jgi:hypothetical protein
MADLNALIAQGYQFQAPPDPFAQYGKMQQLQQGQQANQLNQMKMQEYQRGMEETNAMRRLDPAAADYLTQVSQINPKTGFEFAKLQREAATAKLANSKTQMDIAETKRKLLDTSLRNIASNPSDENIKAHTQDYALNPLFTNEMPSILVNAEQLLKMTPEQRKLVLSSAGATAGDLSTAESSRLGRLTTERGQDMVDARAKQANSIAQQKLDREPNMQPPVAIVDPVTGKQVYVTRNQAIGQTPAAAMESLPPKEIQKREASYPQATSSIKGFENKSDNFIKDLEKLRDDPGLENITGAIYGRTGSVTREGSRAQALYDKVVAKGGFQALQDMRDASKSGGALGNVSNQEGKQLQASVAAIDRRQNSADVKAALNQLIDDIKGSKTRMREAYDTTYQYKSTSGTSSTPAAGKGDGVDTSNPLLR